MRLEQSFEVPVPVAQAWGVLLDLERIAPCMPGASLTSFDGTAFTGTVKVKLGPISLSYKGNGRITEQDEAGRRIALVASGQDSRGAGGASARITAVLHDQGGTATQVRVIADLDIAGKAAQFGRGLIADVSTKLVKQFAQCLADTIATTPVAAPVAAPAPAVASVAAASSPAPPVDAVAPPSPPPLAPVFTEPTPAYTAPPATNTNPPEYHPLAMQEPEGVTVEPIAPPKPDFPEVEPAAKPESDYAYSPEPTPAASSPAPAPAPVPAPAARKEAEPIDLLAVSGAKGAARRAAPVLILVALALVGLVVWLALR